MTSLSEHLRIATRSDHTALDRALLASGTFREVERYARFVRRMADFHRDVERRLAGHPITVASGHRVRSCDADADVGRLGEIGVDLSAGDGSHPDGARQRDPSEATTDPAKIVGMLYVVEGSSLGGLHLARLVRRHLPEASGAVSFLDGVGDDTHARWERTTGAIDRSGADPDAAAVAACETFRLASERLGLAVGG